MYISGFVYGIREAIVNDLVTYRLNGSNYVSCIVTPEYEYIAKHFIFADIFILFIIPLLIIVGCYSKVRKPRLHFFQFHINRTLHCHYIPKAGPSKKIQNTIPLLVGVLVHSYLGFFRNSFLKGKVANLPNLLNWHWAIKESINLICVLLGLSTWPI